MREYVNKLVIPAGTLAISGALTLLVIYVCYVFAVSGGIALKWYDFTEPGTAIEITVSNLLFIGALSGLILGGVVRLLSGIQLTDHIWAAILLGIAGAVAVALLFAYLVYTSRYYHGPVAPGG